MTMPEVTTYARPQLSPLDMANVEKKIRKCPVLLRDVLSVKVQIENARLLKQVIELRNQRNLTPLREDAEWNKAWDEIEKACQERNGEKALRMVLRENMQLTCEIQEHQKALGQKVMKSYKAG